MPMMLRLTAFAAFVAGVVLPTVLGMAWPAYDPMASYISELGARGAPNAQLMSFGGFLPAGALWALGLMLIARMLASHPPVFSLLLLTGVSVSYVGAAFFPCDAGCPMEGSNSQMIHNAIGLVGYLTAPFGFFGLARAFGARAMKGPALISYGAMLTSLAGFGLMIVFADSEWQGAAQRLADYSLFAWLLALSFLMRAE